MLGEPVSPALAAVLHDRTQGIPFFLEELAQALRAGGRLCRTRAGSRSTVTRSCPCPTPSATPSCCARPGSPTRPATPPRRRPWPARSSTSRSSPALDCEAGLGELLRTGLVEEREAGRAALPPRARARRRSTRACRGCGGARCTAAWPRSSRPADGTITEIAAHLLAAGEREHAVNALLAAAAELASVHAYRDAARTGRRALELWEAAEHEDERLAGARALRAVGRARRRAVGGDARAARGGGRPRGRGRGRAPAAARRPLRAPGRPRARAGGATGGRRGVRRRRPPGEAARERLAAAAYLQSSGRHSEAVELATLAGEEAVRAERVDLRARALGLQGVARAKRGEFADGAETVRAGLSLALEHELTAEAAELYQRLGTVLETGADYGGAQQALASALDLCEAGGTEEQTHVCLSCMAYVLRELGEWDRSAELCRELEAGSGAPDRTLVVDGILGSIHGFRGDARRARPLLLRCLTTGTRLDVVSMTVDSAAALGWLDADAGEQESAAGHYRLVLERWQRSEDHHYAVAPLRLAACHFARHGDLGRARGCAEALSSIAAAAGHADALAALAHALAETALAEGDADAAADQLGRALELHDDARHPVRARPPDAARRFRARRGRPPRAGDRPPGRRPPPRPPARGARDGGGGGGRAGAARRLARADARARARRPSTRRPACRGASSRSCGWSPPGARTARSRGELFLSSRTVDMHVRNILAKLRCRSRTEATARAGELGLLSRTG